MKKFLKDPLSYISVVIAVCLFMIAFNQHNISPRVSIVFFLMGVVFSLVTYFDLTSEV